MMTISTHLPNYNKCLKATKYVKELFGLAVENLQSIVVNLDEIFFNIMEVTMKQTLL